jgi:ribonuclease G
LPLPWFRRKKSDQEQPSPAAEVEPPRVETPAPPAEGEQPAQKKRRRGSRGGRGRKKPGAATAAVAEQAKPAAKHAPKTPARERKEPAERQRRSTARRRQPPRRAPLPAAKRELLVSVDVTEQRVAVLEDGRVAEVYLERPERRSIAGNIYKGVVDNVLPGMEAAFVEIGLEKNGFLFVDEIVGPELEGRRPRGRRITDLISRGEEVRVQAVKDPMKTKGARLTTEISLPGRFVVYVPSGEGLGVSRRLEEDERTRLRDIVKAIAPKEGGVIVRTAAEGASADDVRLDLEFLMKLWKQIQARERAAKAPALIFQEAELPLRVTRDLFTGDFELALVDDDRALKRIQGYLKKTSPHMAERVSRYRDKTPLFEAYGVDAEIRSTLSRRVNLPSGGYLIFDYAEAFTVIDVNTGRFVGSRSKSSGQRLEDTVTKNNLEAVKEVVRQLRLRDIGGIIVIDFIDMANPKNREAVERALQQELERDRTKTYVVEISPLGLVEMTRQNVTDGPREILTRKCPTCAGEGVVVSEATAVVDAERRLRALAASKPRTKAFRVELNDHVAELLVGPGAARLEEIEAQTRRRFFVQGKAGVGHDHFAVLDEGTVDKVAPEGAPVDEGQSVEVKLVEVGRFDARSAIAKLDGYTVSVGGAAKLVGKKANVRIARVLDGTAYAVLADDHPAPAAAPITAEAQAEKPTRASRAKKMEPEPEPKPEPEPASVPEAEAEVVEGEVLAEVDEAAAEAPPKKKTRRGSRGGRGRKKKPAVAANAAEAAETPQEPEPVAEPPAEGAEQPAEAAPKKKTRRGSRGGRGRKKPAAVVAVTNGAGEAKAAEPRRPTIHVPETTEAVAANGDEPSTAPARKKSRRGSRGGRRHRRPAGAATAEQSSDEG